MPKLTTGEYLLRVYDRYGSPLKDRDAIYPHMTAAKDAGRKMLDEHIVSYTIDRRVANSLDRGGLYYAETDLQSTRR